MSHSASGREYSKNSAAKQGLPDGMVCAAMSVVCAWAIASGSGVLVGVAVGRGVADGKGVGVAVGAANAIAAPPRTVSDSAITATLTA